MEKKIKIGSQVFFSGIYEDYNSHDEDYIIFVKNPTLFKDFMNIRGKGKDYWYKPFKKEDFPFYKRSNKLTITCHTAVKTFPSEAKSEPVLDKIFIFFI